MEYKKLSGLVGTCISKLKRHILFEKTFNLPKIERNRKSLEAVLAIFAIIRSKQITSQQLVTVRTIRRI